MKAISASARSRASSGPSPHSGSDAGSSSGGRPASASSASASASGSASFNGTPASASAGADGAGSAAGSGSGSGSGAVLPHLAREALLEGLFGYLDKRGYGEIGFRDVFVAVAVLRGLVSGAGLAGGHAVLSVWLPAAEESAPA